MSQQAEAFAHCRLEENAESDTAGTQPGPPSHEGVFVMHLVAVKEVLAFAKLKRPSLATKPSLVLASAASDSKDMAPLSP